MAIFRYHNLMVNIGQAQNAVCGISCDFGSGCAGFNSGCGNFPNTCHVVTCFGGSKICGLPSCNFTGPIGPDPGDPIILAKLKSDLQEAIHEIEELEKKQDKSQVDAALKEIDAAAADLKKLRADVVNRKKGK